MFSNLKLSNFRIFDDEVVVRFKPITILIGKNSSGKSTILKFLLMLKQSAMSSSENFPVVRGNLVTLGPFFDLKNTLSEKQCLNFGLSFHASSNFVDFIPDARKNDVAIDEGNLLITILGEVPYSDNPQSGKITYLSGDTTDLSKFSSFSARIKDSDLFYFNTLMSRDNKTRKSIRDLLNRFSSDEEPFPEKSFDDLTEELMANELGIKFQSELLSTTHLPPIRGDLSRLVDFSKSTRESTERSREDTLIQLRQIARANSDSFRFLSKHLHNVTAIESLEFRDDPLEKGKVIAKNSATGAKVSIADFGFGVSQFLPILVIGTGLTPHSCLTVEQPEAQLHPTAQLHLGSFFAELWTKRQVNSIIETHSHNLLLRIRRLIAKGDLSHEDVSVAFFTIDEERKNVPIVKNLDIYADGSMEPGLPLEFFAADIWEGLKLGAGV